MHIDVAVVDSHAREHQVEAAVPNANPVGIFTLSAAELKPSIQFAELIPLLTRGRKRETTRPASLVNPSNVTIDATVPAGKWRDLYGATVPSTLAMAPVTAATLVRA